jgi:LemA protein
MKKGLIVIGSILVIGLVLVGGLIIGPRNQLINAQENMKAAWSQVENVLQRRSDLIPNLVATVKGYAKHEKEIFTQVAEARAKLGGARTIPEKIQANQNLESALSRLLVVVERYPELKANQNFMALQDELAGTENRIAVERLRYNDAVRSYNLLVRRFPSSIAAGLFHFEPSNAYFEAAAGAKEVPKVEF